MPDNDSLKDLLSVLGVSKPTTGTLTNTSNEYQPDTLGSFLSGVKPPDYHLTTDSNLPIGAPNPKYNTTDFSRINVDQEVFNNTADDMWNSFKRGIDSIQIATTQGKLNYSPFGDAAMEIVDNYPDQLKALNKQKEQGIISEVEYQAKLSSLEHDLSIAKEKVRKGEEDIKENEEEIKNEPVSKEYEFKNWLAQSQGDAASIIDKLTYSFPNLAGSSMSLMIPQLAATFGSNLTKALIKSSAAYILGPEAGVPANIISTVGAVASSIAEITYARAQESYGEVGSSIIDNQKVLMETELPKMMNSWAKEQGIDLNNIPKDKQDLVNNTQAEFARQLRIQSRKGASMQFKENMALAALDVVEAVLMPMSNLGTGLSALTKFTRTAEELAESAQNYNKATKMLSTLGRASTEALGEKFEEGYQYAAQKRGESESLGYGSYDNSKSILSKVLSDTFDTVGSLNYALLPGINLRGTGRYSQDKEFQFSENTGGLLGMVMGAVPTSLSIAKDLKAYRQANKDLMENGIQDIDGKYKRIQTSILKDYFDKDQTHHLAQAVMSLTKKTDEKGDPILKKEDAVQIIDNMKEAYHNYTAIADKLDRDFNKQGTLGLWDSKEQKVAKEMIKEDLLHSVLGIQDKSAQHDMLQSEKAAILVNDAKLLANKDVQKFQDLQAQLEAVDEGIAAHNSMIDSNPDSSIDPAILSRHLESLESKKTDILRAIDEESQVMKDRNVRDIDVVSHSAKLADVNRLIVANSLFLDDDRATYAKLDKIKTNKELREYYDRNLNRLSQPIPDIQEETPTPVPEEAPISTTPPAPTTDTNDRSPEENINNFIDEDTKAIKDAFVSIADAQDTNLNKAQKLMDVIHSSTGMIAGEYDFPGIYNVVLRDVFAGDDATLRRVFPELKKLIGLIAQDDADYALDDVSMDLVVKGNIPPTQEGDEATRRNAELQKIKESGDPLGSGLKITSSLSIAQHNVVGIKDDTGKWMDNRGVDGKLKFNEHDDQQLINTNLVKEGTKLIFQIENIPAVFDISDTSDSNYDKVEIGIYIDTSDNTRRLIGYMHRLDSLPRLIADPSPDNLEREKALLRVNRRTVIEAGQGAVLTAQITKKNSGFLSYNRDATDLKTTISNVIGQDTRPRFTIVDEIGHPVPIGRRVLNVSNDMTPGATVLLLPNNDTYFPAYVTKNKLSVDPKIQDAVATSITKFLETGNILDLREAENYVYITRVDEDRASLGKKGIARFVSSSGELTVQINDQFFTKGRLDNLPKAVGEVYFSISKQLLLDEGYQRLIMNSPVVTTNIVTNPILLSRAQEEYTFLDENKYSYFHQHTIEHTSIEHTSNQVQLINTGDPRDSDKDNTSPNVSINPGGINLDELDLGLDLDSLGLDIPMDDVIVNHNSLLVSKDIPASLQGEIVNSLAFDLLNTDRTKDSNVDRAQKVVQDKYNGLSDLLKKRDVVLNSPIHLEQAVSKSPNFVGDTEIVRRMTNNYRLILDNFEPLIKKAKHLLAQIDFVEDEEGYYENNLDEDAGDHIQYNDDNRERDPKQFLPSDVKKLLFFIPELVEVNVKDYENKTLTDKQKEELRLGYKPRTNSLGMSSFNEFNDTWEKVLSTIADGGRYQSSIEGFNKMIDVLANPEGYLVAREVGRLLKESTTDQVKNAFFRKANLQKVFNKSMLYFVEAIKDPNRKDINKKSIRNEKTTARIINADQRQSERSVSEELHNEFRVANTGMLVREQQEDTGRDIWMVDSNKAKEVYDKISEIIRNPANFVAVESKKDVNIKDRVSTTFTDPARDLLYNIIKNEIGINISEAAFKDLLKYHRAGSLRLRQEVKVVEELFMKRILKTLMGRGDDAYKDYATNNPFVNNNQDINIISKYEYKYRKQLQSGAYRYQGKSYYPYGRHSYLSEIFTAIDEYKNTGVDDFIQYKLNNDAFASRSRYLNILKAGEDKGFINSFGLFYELGSTNKSGGDSTKMLKDMTPREHQIAKLKHFQNQGRRNALFFYDTLSDKTTKPIIQVNKVVTGYSSTKGIDAKDIILSDENLEQLYIYFLSEYNRINNTAKQNTSLPTYELIKGYHDIGKDVGMGKYFNIYYFLNKAVLDVGNTNLSNDLYKQDGTFKYSDTSLIPPATRSSIKSEINKHMNLVFAKTKADFKDLGLYDISRDAKGNLITDMGDLVDHRYLFNEMATVRNNKKQQQRRQDQGTKKVLNPGVIIKVGLDSVKGEWAADSRAEYHIFGEDNLNKVVDYSIVDYVLNYTIFSNEMLMLTGDPAQAGKALKEKDFAELTKVVTDPKELERQKVLAHIESTFTNLGKRNAAFLGSGEKGLFDTGSYNISISNDMPINATEIELYKSWFPDNIKAVEKSYGSGDLTDAQEFTTIKEHLQVMKAYGQIDSATYKKALYVYDPEQYKEDLGTEEPTINPHDKISLFKQVMQPMKPVQRTFNISPSLRISKQFYIKTSSYPLIPSLVEGAMKDMLEDMKKNKVDRVSFVSGVKQGVSGSKDILNTDKETGEVTYNKSFFKDNKTTLNRDGFRIQLEVPYKEYKDHIREGTQPSKLLFVDIPEHINILLQGKDTPVSELKKNYIDYHKNIIDLKTQELYEELGVRVIDGVPIMNDLRELSKILIKEGEGRGYALNSLIGMQLTPNGEFEIPLTFLPNAGQIEPVITAIISNRIAKLKMPGKSYIQGSPFALKRGKVETSTDKRDIIWTKPEYAGLEELKYLRKEDGIVKPAQIVMPFYFIKDGKRVSVKDYLTKDKDQDRFFLDTTKIDPELLEMNGFRIPFQGHNSGMWFEIVGFLPEEAGDLIIVPGQIAAQMGSDYDVDKLFAYMYNYEVGERITKVSSTDPKTEKELQNALIDIHKAIFTASEESILKSILNPLSFQDIENTINKYGSQVGTEFLGAFDSIYQRDIYFSNITGKSGTAISANANTSHALAQTANLYVKGQGIIFKDEEGNIYSDYIPGEDKNRVNELREGTYDDKSDDDSNQNKRSNESAWRLDKIWTFDGRFKISDLISQVLGVSVDNAKEQKLGAFGINKHNFNTALSIIRTGFNFDFVYAFINQPILKMYYRAIGETEDIFKVDYTPGKRQAAIDNLFNHAATVSNMSPEMLEDLLNSPRIEGYSLSELSSTLNDEVDMSNAAQQINILKAFLHYKSIADALQDVTGTFNVDVKGNPKNMAETAQKVEDIQDAQQENDVLGNISNYVSRTIPGLFLNVPGITTQLFMNPNKPIFAYNSDAYKGLFSQLVEDTGRKAFDEEKINLVHNHIKQFIYSGFKMDEELDKIRQRLVFDYTDNESMVTRLIRLLSEYPNNDLLNAIKIDVPIFPDNPKLLTIRMSNEDDYVQRVSEYWEYMLYEGDDAELRNFAEDLTKYALFVNPQEFGQTNTIKYIPPRYLIDKGFTKYLRDKNLETSNKDAQDNRIDLLGGMSRQFAQHNPNFLISAREADIIEGSDIYINKQVLENGQYTLRRVVLNSFSLPMLTDDLSKNSAASLVRVRNVDGMDEMYYPTYLAYYNNDDYKKQVYERVGNADGTFTYYRIDRLGDANMSEYNKSSSRVKSIIKTNQSSAVLPTKDTTNVSIQMGLSKPVDTTRPDYLQPYAKADDILVGMIDRNNDILADTSTTRQDAIYAKFYSFMAQTLMYKGLNSTEVNLDDTLQGAGNTSADGAHITFNPRTISIGRTGLNSELERQRTILHEMIHALTFKEMSKSGQSKEFKAVMEVWSMYKKAILNDSKEQIRGINKSALEAELFTVLKQQRDKARGDVDKSNLLSYAESIISNDESLKEILKTVGDKLSKLAEKGDIKKTNFDLTSDRDRYNDIKTYLIEHFLTELPNSINKYYSYFHPYEFITEAMTNAQTQKLLQGMPSIWAQVKSAIKDLIASILGIESEERTLFDDALDNIFDYLRLNDDKDISLLDTIPNDTEPDGVRGTTNTYQYYGADYTIVLDQEGKGVDVVGYKGKYDAMKKILDNYNMNPDIDPQSSKPFRNISSVETPKQEAVKTKEELLNPGQVEAVQKAMSILNSPRNQDIYKDMFLLSGKGGTGKTFATEVVVDKLIISGTPKSKIFHVAPTWNAVNEVMKASSRDNYEAYTLASFVGTELSEPDESGIQKFVLFDDAKIQYMLGRGIAPGIFSADVIIIDEASMIGGDGKQPTKTGVQRKLIAGREVEVAQFTSSDAWQTILYRLAQRERMGKGRPSKILFVGDYAQIPPIGTATDHDAQIIEILMKSPATYHVLTENMRTGNEDLDALHNAYRINIDKAREAFKQGIPSNESITRNPIPYIDRKDSKNITYVDNSKDAVDRYVELYKQDPQNVTNVVFVNYNRYSRPETRNLISAIRQGLFGTDVKNDINPGELMILNGNMDASFVVDGKSTDITWHNETRFYVKDIQRNVTRVMEASVGKDSFSAEFKGNSLRLVTDYGKHRVEFEKFVPAVGEIERVFGQYQGSIKGYMVNGRKIPYSLFLAFKEQLPQLHYGYVVNSHKVQGSTYNHTIVDEGNILNSPTSNKEANNLVYTAISRPKHSLMILNGNNPVQTDIVSTQEQIPTAQPVQTNAPQVQKPYPGVVNIPDSGLTVDQANQFIDLLQPQIRSQAYIENKARTANRMFSFGLRWAKKVPNPTEKSRQNSGQQQGRPRPNQVPIQSYNDYTYGYFTTDQNNNPIPSLSNIKPIIDFVQSKIGINMNDYDSMLANIYENNSFIHQHRDITESKTAINYPVIVINLGADGGLIYDKVTSDKDLNSSEAYAQFESAMKEGQLYDQRIGTLPIRNGGIYAFGVGGVNRFTFNHRIKDGIGATPTKPITVPIFDEQGNKTGEQVLANYRITLTFRRAQDVGFADESISDEQLDNILDQLELNNLITRTCK